MTRVLSAIQPTSDMHIGNYFGALRNWVDLQEKHDCLYGIVDLHAMTMPYDPAELRKNTKTMAIDLLACGLDPKKSTLFIQSLVPEHLELYWILSCFYPFGELTRMVQFKEKSEQLKTSKDGQSEAFLSAGLFTYPVLQAADILIYKADLVPVGKDQAQHLEGSRDLAQRFNGRFGEVFRVPKALHTESPKVMSLADPTKKMSKSLGRKHFIGLFEEEAVLRNKVASAVTDAGPGTLAPGETMSPGVENLFEILKACESESGSLAARAPALQEQYEDKKLKYVDLKGAVADALVNLTSQFRKRRAEIEKNKNEVWDRIVEMSERARATAAETLSEVRRVVGLPKTARRRARSSGARGSGTKTAD